MISIKNLFRDFKKNKKLYDSKLIIVMYLIAIISLIFVYSASKDNAGIYFLKKEVIWIILGTVVFLFFSIVDYKTWMRYSMIIYIFNLLMLASVYIIGASALGAQRWISLGLFRFQPSSFAKILILITLSTLIVKKYPHGVKSYKGVIRTGIHILIPFILILKQPDLGTAMIIVFLYLFLIFVYELELKFFFTIIGLMAIISPIGFFFLKSYQRSRLLVFLDPSKYAHGSGWNIIQSKITVGSGRLFGQGLFRGSQNNLNFLPESHTDFIFAVIAEEIGFIGSVFIILVYLYLIILLLRYAKKIDETFGKLLLYGIAMIIFIHVFINIGMVIGIMPIVGVPLIFMSYGGSSFILFFIMMGIAQNIIIKNKYKI